MFPCLEELLIHKKKIEKEGNPFYFPKFHEKSQNKYEDISTASGEIFNTFLDYPG